MAADVERRRAGEESRFGIAHRASTARHERGLQLDEQLLCLRRADRHAAGRRGERARRAGCARSARSRSARGRSQQPPRGPDDDRVMRRISDERADRSADAAGAAAPASAVPAGRWSRAPTERPCTRRRSAPRRSRRACDSSPAAASQARHAAASSPRPHPSVDLVAHQSWRSSGETRACLAVGLEAARMREGADRKLRVEQLQQPEQPQAVVERGRGHQCAVLAGRAAVEGRRSPVERRRPSLAAARPASSSASATMSVAVDLDVAVQVADQVRDARRLRRCRAAATTSTSSSAAATT